MKQKKERLSKEINDMMSERIKQVTQGKNSVFTRLSMEKDNTLNEINDLKSRLEEIEIEKLDLIEKLALKKIELDQEKEDATKEIDLLIKHNSEEIQTKKIQIDKIQEAYIRKNWLNSQ